MNWDARWKDHEASDDPFGMTDASLWRFTLWAIAIFVWILVMSAAVDSLERGIHEREKRRGLLAQTSPRPAPARQLRTNLRRRGPAR